MLSLKFQNITFMTLSYVTAISWVLDVDNQNGRIKVQLKLIKFWVGVGRGGGRLEGAYNAGGCLISFFLMALDAKDRAS